MNQKNLLIGLVLMLGVALWTPATLLAGEHGGKEHGGTEPAAQEHGGKVMEGSHGMTEDHAATLKEAAKVLREAGRSDLADKLEAMAKMEE